MKGYLFLIGFVAILAGCSPSEKSKADDYILETKLSGFEFLQGNTKALQLDDFENPGFLWVEQGARLFEEGETGKRCTDCHGNKGVGLRGEAKNYPQIAEDGEGLINLEGRINLCRTKYQLKPPHDYESDELLSLTAFVANLSKGEKLALGLNDKTQPFYERGHDYFYTKRGQFNLSCHQCHNENWGKKLRGDTISQGHGNGFPAYRFEWEELGSLHRRFADCDTGVRAKPHDLGSDPYLALELYLAIRASRGEAGLEIEAPAVRR